VGWFFFDGEDVVGLMIDQVGGQLALGQQGIGGERFSGEIEGFEERDGHAD
jgi:hypothetical protein